MEEEYESSSTRRLYNEDKKCPMEKSDQPIIGLT